MRNLNSSSLADFCYTGENCHQAGDKGGREAGEKKKQGREGRGREKEKGKEKKKEVFTRNGLRNC